MHCPVEDADEAVNLSNEHHAPSDGKNRIATLMMLPLAGISGRLYVSAAL